MMEQPGWFEGDVSRETLDKLAAYADLLRKWTVKINLIAPSTISDLEARHVWDSAQAYQKTTGSWLDFGSGGGMPAVVVAVLAQGAGHALDMTAVESDQRKATFLRTCARVLDVPMRVVAERIEDVAPQSAHVVSARAVASLDQLLLWSAPHMHPDGCCVFLKGARWAQEIDAAKQNWRFSYDAKASMTDAAAAILTIRDVKRV